MRILPHPSNFTPTLSSITYGVSTIKDTRFCIAPILMIFITDLIISLIQTNMPIVGIWMLYTYPVYILNGLIARLMIKDVSQYGRISAAVLISSVNFFILTNLGYYFEYYALTFENLVTTYVEAIPFFGYELQANIMFSLIFFAYHYLMHKEEKSEHQEHHGLLNNSVSPVDESIEHNTNYIYK